MKDRKRLFMQRSLLVALLMCFFGIILVSHIKSVQSDTAARTLAERYKQRQAELAQSEEQYNKLMELNTQLLQKKDDARERVLSQEGFESLLADLERYEVLAGFTEVRGPGIILTLNDKSGFNSSNPLEIVHDSDVRQAFDILRSAGAAAISINGLRITNVSYVTCIGPTIKCNNQRMTPPYVITVLGDPAALAAAVRDSQVFVTRQNSGIQLKIDESEEVIIPPFTESDIIDRTTDLLEVAGP